MAHVPNLLLVSPDLATALFVERAVQTHALGVATSIVRERGWQSSARAAIDGEKSILLLVGSPALGKSGLQILEEAEERGWVTMVWSISPGGIDGTSADEWLPVRLLEQSATVSSTSLPVLMEAARILIANNLEPITGGIHAALKGPAVSERLLAEGGKWRLLKDGKRDPHSLEVRCSKRGELSLELGSNRSVALTDPTVSAAALALLRRPTPPALELPEIKLDEGEREQLEMFVRPPDRMLSETASKRLLTLFGLAPGKEQLCRSATEAVRYAADIEGPVVLKLVKPRLAGKSECGAVIKDLRSSSDIRQAVHQLNSLGRSLGDPAPLGILVAKQEDRPPHLWLQLLRHSTFGLLVTAGPGDRVSDSPAVVVAVPASKERCQAAVSKSTLALAPSHAAALAGALWRFSSMLSQIGPRLKSGAIHPLAFDEDGEPVVLDALIEIGQPS